MFVDPTGLESADAAYSQQNSLNNQSRGSELSKADLQTRSLSHRWPIEGGRVTSAYGKRDDARPTTHNAIDLAGKTPGERGKPILASERGVVSAIGETDFGSSIIKIIHPDSSSSLYLHTDDTFSTFRGVKVTDSIKHNNITNQQSSVIFSGYRMIISGNNI